MALPHDSAASDKAPVGVPVPGAPAPEAAPAPRADLSQLSPRAPRGASFEQNPLNAPRPSGGGSAGRAALDDGLRVREALRRVIEEGDSLKEAARDLQVAPSSVAEWRARYQDLLAEEGAPLFDVGQGPKDADLTQIPEVARELFSENWERLVTETETSAATFKQNPRQVFLQTSRFTSWLYQDGELDRSVLAGVLTGVAVLGFLLSFLLSARQPAAVVALPEAPVRGDVLIEEAAVAAQAFFQADNWKDRLQHVRQPEAVAGMMEAFYQSHPDGSIKDAALVLGMPDGHVVNLGYDVPSLGRTHFITLMKSKGRYLVDWESSSLYQESNLSQLREARSAEPTRIAVTIARNEDQKYYNYAFSDESRWVCYQLGYPGMKLNLYGYVAKEAPLAKELDELLGVLVKHAAVLEVRYPAGATADNQVEIISLLRGEWVPKNS